MADIADCWGRHAASPQVRCPPENVECISTARATTAAIVEVSALRAFATAGAASRLLPMLRHMRPGAET